MIYIYFSVAIIITAWYFYNLGGNQMASEVEGAQEALLVLAQLVDDMQTKLNEHGIEFDNEMLEEADRESQNS